VISTITYTLGSEQDNLTLGGTAAINGTGNALANILTGNAGNNVLDGAAGADVMAGGAGNDTYYVDNTSDVITELAGQGTDTVISTITYTLGSEQDNLTLGGAAAINGTGNALNNVLTGNSAVNTLSGGDGNDTLDGAAGADVMAGGAGNDTYYVDNTSDVITELAGQGTDTVISTITYTLGSEQDNLTLGGTAAINGTGNALANILTGNAGNNILDGGVGADTMTGGVGNDTYLVDNASDIVNEGLNEGIDTVISSVTRTLGVNQENLTLSGSAAINGTGNELSNILTGNAATNQLDGKAGADTMAGGAGDDVYYVDNAGDVVVEGLNEGADTIYSSVSYTLGSNQEHVVLSGISAINATGNELSNNLYSNAGDNVMDGAAGVDQVVYSQATAGVTVSLAITGAQNTIGAGTDTLLNIENLHGSTFNDVLTGNALANTLNGSTGADTMAGGAGEDSYYVDNAGDVVIEALNEGVSDIIYSTVSYTTGANVERLYLSGATAINATGNELNNSLYGQANTAANALTGGVGNDAYYVGAGDSVVEAAGGGIDNVYAYVDYTLGANQENLLGNVSTSLRLNGNELDNSIIGNTGDDIIAGGAGNDSLNGGAGADTMTGGLGNDSYIVDNIGDVIVEQAGEGTETVSSSVTYTLAANLENLTLSGSAAINGTGNALNNILTGNAGNNVLDGGAGADVMAGGAGNDTYHVDNTSDVITELAGQGTDTVISTITYTLGSEQDNLTLGGTAAINGTGNALANILTGNAGNNILDGGAGADTLIGGAGDDTYLMDRGYGNDTIQENDSTSGAIDMARFGSGVAVDQLWFRQVANNLEASIIGTGDSFTISNWFLGNQYKIEQFKTADGKTLMSSQVQSLVQAMAAFSPPPVGQTSLSASYSAALSPVIATNWQ
jgi:trimeric autotransporter adhesin